MSDLVSERGSHLLTIFQPSMKAQSKMKTSPNSGNASSNKSKWRMAGPSIPTGFFNNSWVNNPTDANMHTRPCLISASRYCFKVAASLPLDNPRGSKKPVGATSPAANPVGFSGKIDDIFNDDLTFLPAGAKAINKQDSKYKLIYLGKSTKG